MKTLLTIVLTAIISASVAWYLASSSHAPHAAHAPAAKATVYQCAMHPWIRSDKPGRCPICGMELTPVGDGADSSETARKDGVLTLSQAQEDIIGVRTEAAAVRPLRRTMKFAGVIGEDESRHRVLSAYTGGRIDKLYVNYTGEEFDAGRPLAEIYSPELLQAEREYRQLDGNLKHQAALRLRQMGLDDAQIAAVEHKSPEALTSGILAPVGGTVVSRSVYAGQYVTTGQPLFEIADFSTMWCRFEAYEEDMPWLRLGLKADVTTPSAPGTVFQGTIAFIDPNFNNETRTAAVRVELPNPKENGRRKLANRLFAEGTVALEAPEVLAIPRSAMLDTGTGPVAFVDIGGGTFERRKLKTGLTGDTDIEVLSGVSAGEKVVTNGNLLIDGQAEISHAFSAPGPAVEPLASQEAAAAFLKVADAMAAALGADDLERFNRDSAPAMKVTDEFIKSLGDSAKDAGELAKVSHFHGFTDIKAARAAFIRFSVVASKALGELRKAGPTPPFEIYECGMAGGAAPGAPKTARWIQTGDRKMANPFYGSEMQDCGELIRP